MVSVALFAGMAQFSSLPGLIPEAVAAPSGATVVSSLDFTGCTDVNTYLSGAPWQQDGGPAMTCVPDPADPSNTVLQIVKTNGWDGLQSVAGTFTTGQEYTLSMDVMLAPGDTSAVSTHFTASDYTWLGSNTAVNDSGWTTITVDWTVSAGQTGVYIDGTAPATILVDNLTITTPAAPPTPPAAQGGISTSFENNSTDNNLGSWQVRAGSSTSAPAAAVTTDYAQDGTQSACVTNRSSEGDGLSIATPGVLTDNATYSVDAWARFIPDGASAAGGMWLSYYDGNAYSQLLKFATVSNSGWTELTGTFTVPANTQMIYFETPYQGGNMSSFCLDNITIGAPTVTPDLTNTPIMSTVDFPVGVAVSGPQIIGNAGDLLVHHYDQVTPENSMKVDAWYDAQGNFLGANNTVAMDTMQFAQDNGLRVYGHNLAWYEGSGMPSWWFDVSATDPTPLTNSAADQAILLERLHDHILGVAKTLSDQFGLFGSATNPLSAFDVVNEAISEDASPSTDGLRDSNWVKILGPDWINYAFTYANQYFDQANYDAATDTGGFADPAAVASRPVKLFLNDFNFETNPGKVQRTIDEVNKLTAAGVAIDGIGDQSHLAAGMVTPATQVEDAMNALAGVKNTWGQPILVAITELDAATGSTSPSQSQLIAQGYYYRDLYDAFRDFAANHPDSASGDGSQLYSVTLWGLDDAQWWRYSSQGPALPFDTNLQTTTTYVYCGIVGATNCTLPALQMAANVFGTDTTTGDISATTAGVNSSEWAKLPLNTIGSGVAAFQARWSPDALSVYVQVTDPTADPTDAVTMKLGNQTYTINRDGTVTGSAQIPVAVVATATGYNLVAQLPLSGAAKGDQESFDVSVDTTTAVTGWDSAGTLGTLTLIEPLSFVGIPETTAAPNVASLDCSAIDPAWADAAAVTTDKIDPNNTTVASPAKGQFQLLWSGNTLYVLATVTDPTPDTSSSNAYEQDSVEIFLDRGNTKAGAYTSDVTQMRVSADNVDTFGSGDSTVQQSWLTSNTCKTATGYVVEAAIDLDGLGGVGTYQGIDFQVNDGDNGKRIGATNWADQTSLGYQSDAHWGVAELLPAPQTPPTPSPTPTPTPTPSPTPAPTPTPTPTPSSTPSGPGSGADTGGSVAGSSAAGELAVVLLLIGLGLLASGAVLFRKQRSS